MYALSASLLLFTRCDMAAYLRTRPSITNWWLLFAVLVAGAAYGYLFHVRKVPLVISGRLVTAREKLAVWAAGGLDSVNVS